MTEADFLRSRANVIDDIHSFVIRQPALGKLSYRDVENMVDKLYVAFEGHVRNMERSTDELTLYERLMILGVVRYVAACEYAKML